ncbi:MAG: ester cyclase [Desulfatiglans sp.]|jgi:predicted ester cyclase|nr:ester cyclase [Desulfatiglans sp.]
MTIEDNKKLVQRYIEAANTGNVDNLDQYISPDYVEALDPERKKIGVEGAREHITGVRKTFPDLHLIIEKQIAEGEWVVSCITARATHIGEWLGMKPTGKKVEITTVNVDKVVNGKIVEHGGAANMFEALFGIGAIKIVTE